MAAKTFEEVLKTSAPPEESTQTKQQDDFSIYKTDDDKRLVFGWASVAITVDGEQLEDRQKDIIEPEDLEEAAYEYVLNFRDTGEEHISSMRKKGKLVESVVFTEEKQKAMGIPPGTLPVAWWIGFKIEDDAAWARVKNGTYKMFSIEGKANRIPVEKGQLKGCGVLVVRNGKILSGTRIERGGRGKICGPGGHIEAGETPEEAAKREAREEFGITCEELTSLGTIGDGSSAIFLCTKFSGTPETDEEEMTEPKWRTIEELQQADLFGPFAASLEKLSPAKRHGVAKTFNEILKANPHHDALGRFTTAGAAGSGAAGTAKWDIDKLAAKTAKNMSAYEDKNFAKQLTNAEGEAAAAYTEEIGFEMNKMARGQAIDEEHYDYDEVLDHALNFETALSKAKLPQDAAVFRGASFDTAVDSTGLSKKEIQADPQKLVGKTITELGFMSTSTDAGLAEEYADGMVYHIKLPAGSQAVLQNSLNPYLDGPEITVNRNSKFRVLEAENKGGNTHVYMEYLRTGNSAPKSAPVAKTFEEILKFNPFHDTRGRFASANSFASYSANPKTKAGAMAISRSAQGGHGYTFNVHRESQGENIDQNYKWLNGGPGAKQLAAQGQLASQQPKTPPKPQKNYDSRGFADYDDADFHQLYNRKQYFQQQQLTPAQKKAADDYVNPNTEPGSLYNIAQNLNWAMVNGQTPTGKHKQVFTNMMDAMHNIGHNVTLTRYDHAGMIDSLLGKLGAGTDYTKMSLTKIQNALVGQTIGENKFISTTVNNFSKAPSSAQSLFTNRAVKINYKAKANVQGLLMPIGAGGDQGELVLAPTNGTANKAPKITAVRMTGKSVYRAYNGRTYPQIEIDLEWD